VVALLEQCIRDEFPARNALSDLGLSEERRALRSPFRLPTGIPPSDSPASAKAWVDQHAALH
jgi:hypothetical protein